MIQFFRNLSMVVMMFMTLIWRSLTGKRPL